MSTQKPSVSATVVAYNSASCLRECLYSIRQEVLDGVAELVVVDNASPDDSAQIIEWEFPEAHLIRSSDNLGFSGGCNLAWPHVRGRYWLLLNPDVVVPKNGLRDLVAWMDQHPELGAASPQLVNAAGGIQCPARRFDSISYSLVELLRLHLLLPSHQRGDLLLGSYWKGGDHFDVDWVPGAALIVRREVVEEIGLLSEHFFMYGEDIEWCWRIRRAGWRIGLCTQVQFQHQEGESALRTWGNRKRDYIISRGNYEAYRQTKGNIYTQLLIAINVCAYAIDSLHPRRSWQERRQARRLIHSHIELLKITKSGCS